jgi:GNAT superfamily N-acetyltransferase
VTRCRERSVPAVFFVSDAFAGHVEGLAGELGLELAGRAPLMVSDGPELAVGDDYETVDASGSAELLDDAADMVAAAFKLPREWVGRWNAPGIWVKTPAWRCYVARRDGRSMSTVTISGRGGLVGVWSMATPADLQRRGAGRAALAGAMREARSAGATGFYLVATPEGKALYDSVGFRTIEEFPLYVLPS